MEIYKSPTYSTPCGMTVTNANGKSNSYLTPFPSFTFTNMGATGQSGPTSLTGQPLPRGGLSLTGGIQYWTVPGTKTYTFVVAGAGNANANSANATKAGNGVVLTATRTLNAGTVVAILVGQMGLVGTSDNRATGGSGGTFIATVTSAGSLAGDVLLFAAGGCAGVGYETNAGANDNINGTTSTTGQNAQFQGLAQGNGGLGGAGPNGGGVASTSPFNFQAADAGAGYSGNGANANAGSSAAAGKSFLNGGTGGTNGNAVAYGGFGGGGGGGYTISSNPYPGGGGGGGYGGGGAGSSDNIGSGGGGGGSYDISGVYSGSATNAGMGYVTVS